MDEFCAHWGLWISEEYNAESIVGSASEDGVFGIEVDNDIPGRYESFLHPETKLKAIQAVAQPSACGRKSGFRLHSRERSASRQTLTRRLTPLAKDHPDWLQTED